MRYAAQERGWVAKVLARLTPKQRLRYEELCEVAPRHRSGKLTILQEQLSQSGYYMRPR